MLDESYQRQLVRAVFDLIGEAGRIAEDVKKHIYHEHPLNGEELRQQITDVRLACQDISYIVFEIEEKPHA